MISFKQFLLENARKVLKTIKGKNKDQVTNAIMDRAKEFDGKGLSIDIIYPTKADSEGYYYAMIVELGQMSNKNAYATKLIKGKKGFEEVAA